MNEKQLKTIKGAKYRVIKGDDVFNLGALVTLVDGGSMDFEGAQYTQEGNSYGSHYMYFREIELVELPENALGGDIATAALTKVEAPAGRVEVLEQAAAEPEQAEETPEPLYAVGQKLRVKGNNNPVHHFYEIGTEVEVKYVNISESGYHNYLTVSAEYRWSQTISEADLEPVPQPHISEEEFAAIEVGDKIVLRSDLAIGIDYGAAVAVSALVDLAKRGVEITVGDISSDVLRGHAEGKHWWYTAKMIAKVIPAIKPKFKVGDIISTGRFFFARKITAVDLEKAEYKWVWADGTDPEEEHTNGIEKYDAEYTLHSSFEKPKPKFQVGDVLNRPELGTDMEYARLVTEVDEEKSEYRMQWADGSAPEYRMEYSFEDVKESFIKVEGLPPRLINPKGTVITAGNYYVAEGSIYSTVIKVTDVDVEKQQYTYTSVALGGLSLDACHTASAEESIYFRTAVPATSEQIEQFKQLENPEPAEEKAPEFDNPEVEVGKVYMDDDGWMFYCDALSKVKSQRADCRKIHVRGVPALTPTGRLVMFANYGCNKYREATPEEAVKLLSKAFQEKAA
ncbi:hypothetical protein HED42_08975 [Enterococcus casseliflavus]|uniref:hypothetical protein n=1 Tax=Enterococcus casseliflavus TaxID=37734 RepID=UPI00143337C4|nr:hypothetical protein [Enterococcus casseliflavus]NKD38264.1 hypothetical protein [Enterococcus casseliflavus]